MKVEVRDVLSDIEFFSKTITGIRFMKADGNFYTDMPSIAKWAKGDIMLVVDRGGFGTFTDEIIKRLAHYGINAKKANGTTNNNAVKFSANAGDDIIFVLSNVIKMQRQKAYDDEVQKKADALVDAAQKATPGIFCHGMLRTERCIYALTDFIQNQNQR